MFLGKHKYRNRQSGISMIESLISLVVISVGLLGIAAMQITSLKQASSAQFHSQAVWFNYEMTDRILANNGAFDQYVGIDTDNHYEMDCQNNACSPAQMVQADAEQWKNMVSSLPDGRGVISQTAANTLTVSVYWDDNSDESNCVNGEPDSADKTCYTITMTNIP